MGPEAHGLGLVLVVPDGVEREPEPGRQQPAESERAGERERKRQVIKQQADIAEIGRRIGREHAGPGPDPRDAGGELAGGNAEAERADGEIMPAHRQQQRAEQPGDQSAGERRRRKAHRQPGQELAGVEHELRAAAPGLGIEPDIVEQPDLDDGRDIHADPDEQHIAERVVAHLSAHQIPGEREHDEQQKLGQLRLIGRGEQRRDHAAQKEPGQKNEPRRGKC